MMIVKGRCKNFILRKNNKTDVNNYFVLSHFLVDVINKFNSFKNKFIKIGR